MENNKINWKRYLLPEDASRQVHLDMALTLRLPEGNDAGDDDIR